MHWCEDFHCLRILPVLCWRKCELCITPSSSFQCPPVLHLTRTFPLFTSHSQLYMKSPAPLTEGPPATDLHQMAFYSSSLTCPWITSLNLLESCLKLHSCSHPPIGLGFSCVSLSFLCPTFLYSSLALSLHHKFPSRVRSLTSSQLCESGHCPRPRISW